MRRFTKKRARKIGLPPGSLVHVGEKTTEEAIVTLVHYDERSYRERVVQDVEECFADRQPSRGVTWINLDGVHDIELLRKLGDAYSLHSLTVEDILNTDHHPKLEEFDDYLFVVVKMAWPGEGALLFQAEQLSLVIGRAFILTFREREVGIFDPIRERIRTGKGRVRSQGPDYLAYALVDVVVDHYFLLLEGLEERIEKLESTLFVESDTDVLNSIQLLKRELLYLRRSVWPLREVIGGLQRDQSSLVSDSTRIYLRDVYDHTIQVMETIESFRDLINGLLELHLATISNRMNTIMKVLTIIATIFIPLTFIAGIYGMNFEHMPELKSRWGYPAALVGMALVSALMLLFFRKKKWI
jgi:magnesium transporter